VHYNRRSVSRGQPAHRAGDRTQERDNARVSTVDQDLIAQHDALIALGVDPKRIYVDHGLTGTNRDRPPSASGSGIR
jgi:dihydropteroate synthase